MPWDVEAEVVQPQAAIDWFKRKLAIEAGDFANLSAQARRQAFTVAGAANLSIVQNVLSSLQKALEEGETFQSWQKRIPDELNTAWGSTKGWRSRNVFDTAIQSAYGAGRWQAATESERPIWGLEVVLDGKTSPICLKVAGFRASKDDPAWKNLIPPLHYKCRTALVTLSQEQADELGLSSKAPEVGDLGGFGLEPNANEWTPKESAYDPDLWAAYQKTITPIQTTNAQGTPVSAALELPKSGIVFKAARATLEAIDFVHGDGTLPKIPLTGKVRGRYNLGEFRYYSASLNPIEITVKASGTHPHLTTAHEIGHFLDLSAMPGKGYSSKLAPELKGFRDAIEGSEAILKLRQMQKDKPQAHLVYLLSPQEIWARAYAQFIAIESGNLTMLDELNMVRRVSSMPSQWTDEDFEPIRNEIRSMMRAISWLT